MRISDTQQQLIISTLRAFFADSQSIYLFGSRVDDSKRGGDIDLLVVSNEPALFEKKLRALSRLMLELGEQRIDLLAVNEARFRGDDPVIGEARRGVCLWKKSA